MKYTKILEQNIKVNKAPSVDIMECTDLFPGYIDSYFQNWKLNKGNESPETEIAVLELTNNSNTQDIFTDINTDLNKCVLSISQIVEIVKNNSEILHPDGNSTVFLTQDELGNFFQVNVWYSASDRRVFVNRFENDVIWDASGRRRCVVPQQALCTSDLTLKPSDTLTLDQAIQVCKDNGLKVIKTITQEIEM